MESHWDYYWEVWNKSYWYENTAYDIQTIEGHFIKSGELNKMALAESLSSKHSELKKEYFKLSKSQQNMKMFEAVAVMELAILELP